MQHLTSNQEVGKAGTACTSGCFPSWIAMQMPSNAIQARRVALGLQRLRGQSCPITAAAFPATLMQSEVSIESKLKLIFQEPIDPGVSGQGTEELNSCN